MAAGYGKLCQSWSLADSAALLAVAALLAALAAAALTARRQAGLHPRARLDRQPSAVRGRRGKLGARVVRVEFDIGTPAASLRDTVAALTRRGARPLLLAGFHGRMPTEAEARNLGGWAAAFGPGGASGPSPAGAGCRSGMIEFGNETSYTRPVRRHLLGPVLRGPGRAVRDALRTGPRGDRRKRRPVGLLAQADDGGTASSVWVTHMFGAVPKLGQLVAGWTVHPYGPREKWQPKLRPADRADRRHGRAGDRPDRRDRVRDQLERRGRADRQLRLAREPDLRARRRRRCARPSADMRDDAKIAKRLRLFLVYSAHDLRPPGATNDREAYFGALRNDLTPKGAYTAEVRRLFH